ncbi:MAG: hypothetical protein H6Q06_2785, partial [Acidobacteria bacterium]|nr:hypothetical protein [Acidobacteriota bacterium]
MMLDWLGEGEKGRRLEQATATVINEGKVRTYDMGGSATTMQMAEAIAGKLGAPGSAPVVRVATASKGKGKKGGGAAKRLARKAKPARVKAKAK